VEHREFVPKVEPIIAADPEKIATELAIATTPLLEDHAGTDPFEELSYTIEVDTLIRGQRPQLEARIVFSRFQVLREEPVYVRNAFAQSPALECLIMIGNVAGCDRILQGADLGRIDLVNRRLKARSAREVFTRNLAEVHQGAGGVVGHQR
jgi:hypothetical protein